MGERGIIATIITAALTNSRLFFAPHQVFDALRGKLEPFLPANWTQPKRDKFFNGAQVIAEPDAQQFPSIGVMFPVAGNSSAEFEVTMQWDNYLRDLGESSHGKNYLFSISAMCIQESGVTLGTPLLTATFIQFDRENRRAPGLGLGLGFTAFIGRSFAA